MWSRFCGLVSRVAFVPKGPGEGSLAIYCQECVLKKIRPVGYGMSRSAGGFTAQGRRTFLPTPIIPFPSGTVRFFLDPPGNKLPGYLHLVPSGQTPQAPVHIFTPH